MGTKFCLFSSLNTTPYAREFVPPFFASFFRRPSWIYMLMSL